MADVTSSVAKVSTTASMIVGEELLVDHAVDLSSFEPLTPAFLELASQSARRCECEGAARRPRRSYTLARRAGAPYAPTAARARPTATRSTPDRACTRTSLRPRRKGSSPCASRSTDLARSNSRSGSWRSRLMAPPLTPRFERATSTASRPPSRTTRCASAPSVLGLQQLISSKLQFHFRGLTRRATWVASYSNEFANVELVLDPHGVSWQLTVQADRSVRLTHIPV